jgi:hypothetical protein
VAVMVQLPETRNAALFPDTVHTVGVVDAKLTVNPELAVALSVKGVPTVCAAIVPNVIVCVFSVVKVELLEVAVPPVEFTETTSKSYAVVAVNPVTVSEW